MGDPVRAARGAIRGARNHGALSRNDVKARALRECRVCLPVALMLQPQNWTPSQGAQHGEPWASTRVTSKQVSMGVSYSAEAWMTRQQSANLAVTVLLVFATGTIIGTTKLLQILATTNGGRFATSSESVAEEFLVTFGLSKAVSNVLAGAISDTWGRRPCMLFGWLGGALFCVALLMCTSWTAVVMSDLLLGVNQALCWSSALFIAHDVLGPTRRGVASGLVETVGYGAIAISSPVVSAVDGFTVDGFTLMHLGLLTICVGGAAVTVVGVRETKPTTTTSSALADDAARLVRGRRSHGTLPACPRLRRNDVSAIGGTYVHASCRDRGLMACCLVGLCLNLSTAYAWGAMSRWLASIRGSGGLSVGSLLLIYSVPKGLLQLPAGHLADSRSCCDLGAKGMVLIGLLTNAVVLVLLALLTAAVGGDDSAPAHGSNLFDHAPRYLNFRRALITTLVAPLAFCLGAGTACAYSPIMACVASRSDPAVRASSLGAYRFWRDAGYAVGALLLGSMTDSAGMLWVAPLLAAAALLVAAAIFASVFGHGDATSSQGTTAGGLARADSAAMASVSDGMEIVEVTATLEADTSANRQDEHGHGLGLRT